MTEVETTEMPTETGLETETGIGIETETEGETQAEGVTRGGALHAAEVTLLLVVVDQGTKS